MEATLLRVAHCTVTIRCVSKLVLKLLLRPMWDPVAAHLYSAA